MDENIHVEEIKSRLKKAGVRFSVHYQETVDSTNEWAKREFTKGVRDREIYLADHQDAGKGRRGHVWESPGGTSVSMSILICPQIRQDRMPLLTLIMGMAAAYGIRKETGLDVGIKWPNDIVCSGKKLCGILTEMGPLGEYVIIGIGMNVNVESFPEELKDKAGSIFLETGRPFSREKITAAVIEEFERYGTVFEQTGDMQELREAYQKILVNRDRKVRVLDEKEPFTGTAAGIDSLGRLLVFRDDTGTLEKVCAGEVSVRGMLGYI